MSTATWNVLSVWQSCKRISQVVPLTDCKGIKHVWCVHTPLLAYCRRRRTQVSVKTLVQLYIDTGTLFEIRTLQRAPHHNLKLLILVMTNRFQREYGANN